MALALLAELEGELDVVIRAQAARGLRSGCSFGDVARALGISRQAAHRRYRELPAAGPPRQDARVAATEAARELLRMAGDEALSTGAPTLGSEHVVIAALRCGGDAADALRREGVGLQPARARARAIARDRAAAPAGGSHAGLREVVREATRIALLRGAPSVDVEHLLLAALFEREGGAQRLLATLGVDPGGVRTRLPTRHASSPGTARHAEAA